ncbi:MAG: sulfite exporter TauE/SafE family protein [Candidatus Omnitrophica bacterium]|nr:sulfite exporter TauE/SafE family protein [Candidatus Omnitrophota bacterium]MCF7877942.1 sulfite exporter TauE/SafE family protein [Candidatus Omnitrophota bacterium]MCF7893405.1 sulfite exporter TauE/SafE family protein [Candidatus Omnitrophota bacterium]
MWYLYIALGLGAGIFSGFLGLGGGAVMIPALVYLVGFSQHQAQGTTLAMMIPPIGLLAAIKYYQAGNVKIKVAALMCIGFFVGGYLGAKFVHKIPDLALRRFFGAFLLVVSLKMILGK